MERRLSELKETPLRLTHRKAIETLFFGHIGLIDITSASPGEAALGSKDGGHFTNAMIKLLEKEDGSTFAWHLERVEANKPAMCPGELWDSLRDETGVLLGERYGKDWREKYPYPHIFSSGYRAQEALFDEDLGVWVFCGASHSELCAVEGSTAVKAGMAALEPVLVYAINGKDVAFELFDLDGEKAFAKWRSLWEDAKKSGVISLAAERYNSRGILERRKYTMRTR
jgi:hypothetical protein